MISGLIMWALFFAWLGTMSDTFERWVNHPDRWRWGVGIAAGIWLLAGAYDVAGITGADCYTDWDGVRNATVCD